MVPVVAEINSTCTDVGVCLWGGSVPSFGIVSIAFTGGEYVYSSSGTSSEARLSCRKYNLDRHAR